MYAGHILQTSPTTIIETRENFKSELVFNICNVTNNDVDVVIEISKDGVNWFTLVNTTVTGRDTILLGSYPVNTKTKIRAYANTANAIHLTIFTLP